MVCMQSALGLHSLRSGHAGRGMRCIIAGLACEVSIAGSADAARMSNVNGFRAAAARRQGGRLPPWPTLKSCLTAAALASTLLAPCTEPPLAGAAAAERGGMTLMDSW